MKADKLLVYANQITHLFLKYELNQDYLKTYLEYCLKDEFDLGFLHIDEIYLSLLDEIGICIKPKLEWLTNNAILDIIINAIKDSYENGNI